MATKKRKKEIVPFQEVKFLNSAEKGSMALVGVKINGVISGGTKWGDNYEIKITDCNNQILLHGSLKNPESRKNALAKFDNLIEVLSKSRDHIENQLKEQKLRF